MEHLCEVCGSAYKPTRGGQRFCSTRCGYIGRRVHNKGKGCIHYGYRLITVDGKQIQEHRHVMQQHLGRKLRREEVVHHKDGNRLNNSIDNLELLPSSSEHGAIHCDGFRSETHKECLRCREVKPRTEFGKGHPCPGSDPNFRWCKACKSAYDAERYRKGLTTHHRRKSKLASTIDTDKLKLRDTSR